MKVGDIGLGIAVALMAYIGWIVMDMSTPPRVSKSGGGGASSALTSLSVTPGPVLVEFYADWCGPCRMIGPEVEKLAEELAGKAKVIRINVDEHPQDAAAHSVRGLPTFIAFQSGRETERREGGIPRVMMRAMLGL